MKLTISSIIAVIIIISSYFLLFNHVSLNEVGVAYNRSNGEISYQKTGWHITSPSVAVTYIPDVPLSIALSSATKTLPPKYVRLMVNQDMYKEFITETGFQYYQNFELENLLKTAYFTNPQPKWLKVVED